jgi:DHA2 family multidrug resistance protein-like MFS transporter
VTLQMCYFGSLFLIAVYFQSCLGMSPWHSGLAMMGQSIGTICMLFFSGKLFQKFGPKYILIFGFFLISCFTSLILFVGNPNELLLANLILWARGASIGLVNGPLQACAMLPLKKQETARGSALFNILRQIGISLGVSFSCLLLAWQGRGDILEKGASHNYLHAFSEFQTTFHIFSGIALFGGLFALVLDNKKIQELFFFHQQK